MADEQNNGMGLTELGVGGAAGAVTVAAVPAIHGALNLKLDEKKLEELEKRGDEITRDKLPEARAKARTDFFKVEANKAPLEADFIKDGLGADELKAAQEKFAAAQKAHAEKLDSAIKKETQALNSEFQGILRRIKGSEAMKNASGILEKQGIALESLSTKGKFGMAGGAITVSLLGALAANKLLKGGHVAQVEAGRAESAGAGRAA